MEQAAEMALLCADSHWSHASPVLVTDAVQGAKGAASLAQAARRRAMEVAMKLNVAVALAAVGQPAAT